MPKLAIELDKEIRKELVESIKRYFANERDEELTHLGAELLMDFIVNEIGPFLYNRGVQDSYHYMNDRIEDLLGLEKRPR